MPGTIHAEKHFIASESVRDVVIGMADGLTVPFALAAGLSGAVRSPLTIGLSYVVGGLVPLVPYMTTGSVLKGLAVSAAVTLLALFAFGAVKGRLTGIKPLVGGLQTVGIGGFAAVVAFGIARWIG
jgi:VIT1/CCC1 family predicted Fe2+/Mn2+ transporter